MTKNIIPKGSAMQLKNFDSWIEYEGAFEGNGRSEKVWLENFGTLEQVILKNT